MTPKVRHTRLSIQFLVAVFALADKFCLKLPFVGKTGLDTYTLDGHLAVLTKTFYSARTVIKQRLDFDHTLLITIMPNFGRSKPRDRGILHVSC